MKMAMCAIIKKDLRGITANKQIVITLLIVPLALVIVLPSIFVIMIHFIPEEINNLERFLDILPFKERTGELESTFIKILLNYIMPVFFLIIPIMASCVMAASSFVGEKEKQTLETLMYCPLTIKQIFYSKILACFILSMLVSFVSFLFMIFVVELETFLTAGTIILPDIRWIVIMLLLSPAISFIAITLIVRGSAKSKTMEQAQQGAAFLILPVILLAVSQFTGILLVSTWLLFGLAIVLALLAFLLVRNSLKKFNYETLLK